MSDITQVDSSTPKKDEYLLPPLIQFGFHKEHISDQMSISDDGKVATKIDPELVYAKGVVYSERIAKGHTEFEIEVVSYGTSWSGNFKLGIMIHRTSEKLDKDKIPRYTPESPDHCVWCASKLHDHITNMAEISYGERTLDELRAGDRLGIQITPQGELKYLLNGKIQGIATTDVYRPGYDVYAVVDHYANCKATKITRAITRVDLSLEVLCLDKIATLLSSKKEIDPLPLPIHMKNKLREYSYN